MKHSIIHGSRRIVSLIIEAPDFLTAANQRELITSPRHRCNVCSGSGQVSSTSLNPATHGFTLQPCPVCQGTGLLDAIITIQWQPAKE